MGYELLNAEGAVLVLLKGRESSLKVVRVASFAGEPRLLIELCYLVSFGSHLLNVSDMPWFKTL
jgi:hypothetical protein